MNIKKPSMATPLYPKGTGNQAKAQQQFKSLSKPEKAGSNGVTLHTIGCSGNHLGKC